VGLICSANWHPDEIRMADCYVVTRRNRAFQFVEPPPPCALVQDTLTTKLTTYPLDVLGRLWTMHVLEMRILGVSRRRWTTLATAPCAPQQQGAGAIPVPPAPEKPEFMGTAALCL
jgi:hypothetical protein